MGKGLSPLQKDILAVLDAWPSYEEATSLRPDSVGDWALPRDIIARLGRAKSGATRTAISKALLRLYQRGMIARASGELAIAGKSFRYLRITDSRNGFAGNHGPVIISGRPQPKMRTVS
jgi:DNA-binding MarR family transcriptional regulator